MNIPTKNKIREIKRYNSCSFENYTGTQYMRKMQSSGRVTACKSMHLHFVKNKELILFNIAIFMWGAKHLDLP